MIMKLQAFRKLITISFNQSKAIALFVSIVKILVPKSVNFCFTIAVCWNLALKVCEHERELTASVHPKVMFLLLVVTHDSLRRCVRPSIHP